jgi:hypothetical protein
MRKMQLNFPEFLPTRAPAADKRCSTCLKSDDPAISGAARGHISTNKKCPSKRQLRAGYVDRLAKTDLGPVSFVDELMEEVVQ